MVGIEMKKRMPQCEKIDKVYISDNVIEGAVAVSMAFVAFRFLGFVLGGICKLR